MTTVLNTAEGGSNGVLPTTANTNSPGTGGSSGDAASAVTVAAGDTLVFSTAAARFGTLGYRLTMAAAGAGATRIAWAVSGSLRHVLSFYFKINVLPNQLEDIAQFGNTSATNMVEAYINASNKFGVKANGTGQAASLSASALTAGHWYHVQFATTPGTTTSNGYIGLRVTDASDGSLFHLWESSAMNAGTGTFTAGRLGRTTGRPTAVVEDFDAIQIQQIAGWLPEYGLSANAGADFTVDPMLVPVFTLDAGGSVGTGLSYVWEDITSGTTVLSGSGPTRDVTTPTNTTQTTRTYRVTVTDGSGGTATDTVVVTILPQVRWTMTSGGLIAVRRGL